MPMKVNVGLSQKVGEANYGSRGASVHVELELDSGLVNEPPKLQEKIRQLFTLVRSSLAEELNGNGHSNGQTNGGGKPQANGNGKSNGTPRAATESQRKAIFAIAKAKNIDVQPILRSQFGVNKPEQLNVKQASELIDQLKAEGE